MIEPRRQQNKKLLISLLVALSIVTASAQAQGWQAVKFPTSDDLTGIVFASPDTGYVVTHSGKIARTTDAGRTWGGVELAKSSLEDVVLSGYRYLYVCGGKGRIFKSENGGRDWTDHSYSDTSVTIVSIATLSSRDLLATGLTHDSTRRNVGVLLRSDDDGQSWDRINVSGTGFGEMDVDKDGVVRFASWGYLYSSATDGKSWDKIQLPTGKPGRTLDVVGNTAIMAGNFGQIAYSTDRGKTWHSVDIPKEESHFTSVVLLDEKRAYIAGTDSKVYYSADGGKTWNRESLPITCDIFGLTKSGNRLWAIGKSGAMLYKSIK